MDDNDIIKALECCAEPVGINCIKCPFEKGCLEINMCEIALDLINRQKAEIEKKQKELEITRTFIHNHGLEWELLSYYNKVCGVDDRCDCFIQEARYVNQKLTIVDICRGTKERDMCSCRGYKSRCTFYPKKEMVGDNE